MNDNQVLQKIDRLIDQGNAVWENHCRDATPAITWFCNSVKDLVLEIYGENHPYIEKHQAESRDRQHDFAAGMAVLNSMRKEVE